MSLDLSIDAAVAVPAAMRRRLRTEVARMIRAAARRDQRADYEVSLRLVDDAAIHGLNRAYRHKNKPTDVLAFAQREGDGPSPDGLRGDVVISVDTARRQAVAHGHSLAAEGDRLLVHGLLHLVGYDHERSPVEARRMQRKERALLRALEA